MVVRETSMSKLLPDREFQDKVLEPGRRRPAQETQVCSMTRKTVSVDGSEEPGARESNVSLLGHSSLDP